MSWYKEWFDSPLYETFYASRDEEDAARLTKLFSRELQPGNYPEILDLACGRGRHAIHLAKRGYRVTGMDLSERALEVAQERANEAGAGTIRFIRGDMRQPLTMKFDAVVNFFTSFGYFEEDEDNHKVIEAVGQMLNKGGAFFIDYLNPDYVKENYIAEDSGHLHHFQYKISRYLEGDTINKEIAIYEDGKEEPDIFRERVKLYGVEWFSNALEDAGMTFAQKFGDYTGGNYEKSTSPRLIILAEKR